MGDGSGPPLDPGVLGFGLLLLVGLVLIAVVVVRILVAGFTTDDHRDATP